MKHKILLLALSCCFSVVDAQTFSSSGSVPIPDGGVACGDYGATALSPLAVTAAGTITNPAAVMINININHSYVGDLLVRIIAPDATSCILMHHIGATICDGSGATLPGSNTLRFNSTYTTPLPTSLSTVPAGNYAPSGSTAFPAVGNLATFLTGKSINGMWTLSVMDHFGSFTGTIVGWNLVFNTTALPLNLLSFTGTSTKNGYNELEWQTSAEQQTASFHLERSYDGSHFNKVASVAAVGSGDQTYRQRDVTGIRSTAYYRLKMNDLNGTYTYSKTVRIAECNVINGQASLSPIPATTSMKLWTGNAVNLVGTEAKIIDAMGKLTMAVAVTSSEQVIDISKMPAGFYMVRLANGESIKFNKVD